MKRKLAAALLALGAALPAQAADKVKVTYPTLTTSFIFFFTAIDKGFYAVTGRVPDSWRKTPSAAPPAVRARLEAERDERAKIVN